MLPQDLGQLVQADVASIRQKTKQREIESTGLCQEVFDMTATENLSCAGVKLGVSWCTLYPKVMEIGV